MLIEALLTGLVLSAAPLQETPKEESILQKMEREITSIVQKARSSVVQVTVRFVSESDPAPEALTFSGIVYTKDGYIVTDAGGVETASEVKVSLATRSLAARFVAADRRTGVAVLKVDVEGLSPAVFPDGPAKPGAHAVAVGNSFGLKGSAAVGTVSGLGRTILVAGRKYDDMIQLTTPVYPGDCGGLVADSSGRFIGMIHSVFKLDGESPEGSGLLQLFGKKPQDLAAAGPAQMSFAVPWEWVKFSADRIIKYKKMVRGWVGLSLRALEPAVSAQLGLKEGEGAEVVRVERESPARRALLRTHDVIVEFDGESVRDLEALRRKVAEIEQPRKAKVSFLRNNERREVELDIDLDPQK